MLYLLQIFANYKLINPGVPDLSDNNNKSDTPELISLSNNGRQETKELAEVQEVVQLYIKPIVVYKWLTSGDFSFLVHLS